MAAAPGAFVMRNASTTFDTVEYKNQLTTAKLVPDAEAQQLKTLDPTGTVSDVDTASWVFELAGVQDHVVTQGLCDFLTANHGQEVDVVFQPRAGAGERIATFTCIAKAQDFGGEQGSWTLFETELPVVGEPVWSVSI